MVKEKEDKKDKKNAPMIIGVIIAVVAIIVVLFIIFSPHGNNVQTPTAPPNQPAQSSNQATTSSAQKILFSSSPYSQFAYLISTPTLSTQAKEALTGFKLSSTQNSNGSVIYRLTTANSNYVNQTYLVEPGEKLYFIETSFGDDNAASDADYMFGDDVAVIVDAQGYIVQ